jgi:hypothetical protein
MKKITLILMVLTFSLGFSQNGPIDFETTGNGADWTWTVFENGDTPPPLEIIANPFSEGINTSATVAKYTITTNGGGFAGTETQRGSDTGTWTVTDQNAFVTVMVRQVGFTGTVGVKFANNAGGALAEVRRDVPAADEWVELAFDMSAWIGNPENPVNQFIFFVDINGARDVERVVYFDNVTFSPVPDPTCDDGIQNGDETGVDCGGPDCDECPPPPMPMVAAPTPTIDPSQVINVFSDFYGPNTAQGANDGAIWAGNAASNLGSYSSVTIDGSSPTDYLHFYQGANVVFIPWTPVDATEMEYLHLDIWSPNSTFIILAIQNNASPPQGQLVVNNLVPNEWNSVEIILPAAADRTGLFQLVLDAAGGNDYYFDNIYFSAVTTLSVDNVTESSFEVYPNPTKDNWTLKTKNSQNIMSVQVFDILGKQVLSLAPDASEVSIDASGLKDGIYLTKITTANGSRTLKLVKN